MLKFLLYSFLFLAVLAMGAAGGGLWVMKQYQIAGPAQRAFNFTVPKGAGLNTIAQRLEAEGLISNAYIFRAAAYYQNKQSALKAGEYVIPAHASMEEIMAILEQGRAIQYKLTVAEGLTTAMILDLVRKHPELSGEVTVLPTEGQLLPETYLFPKGMKRDDLIRQMSDDHDRVLKEVWEKRQPDLPVRTPYEAVILASIVEKETGKAHERPHVAGVFVNRLRRGIKLESDPTIIYGITQGYPLGRGIRQSELQAQTPYNTYAIAGLPPTPIANPGRASMAAVLNPMQTDDLFFVADGTGGHAFAATLEEHNKNVARWRQIEKEKAAARAAAASAPPAAAATGN